MKVQRATQPVLFVVLLLVLATACGIYDRHDRQPYVPVNLSPPERQCRSLQNWHGLVPGQATRQDVLDKLGPYDQRGRLAGQEFYEYATTIELEHISHKIYFRGDIIDRIEIAVVAEEDLHTVGEMVEELGSELDVVFVAGDYDIFGPDHVYVWAECGIALVAVPTDVPKIGVSSVDEHLYLISPQPEADVPLTIRHPVHPKASFQPWADLQHVVVFKVLFAPTSYDSFVEAYWDTMPYEWAREWHKVIKSE